MEFIYVIENNIAVRYELNDKEQNKDGTYRFMDERGAIVDLDPIKCGWSTSRRNAWINERIKLKVELARLKMETEKVKYSITICNKEMKVL